MFLKEPTHVACVRLLSFSSPVTVSSALFSASPAPSVSTTTPSSQPVCQIAVIPLQCTREYILILFLLGVVVGHILPMVCLSSHRVVLSFLLALTVGPPSLI